MRLIFLLLILSLLTACPQNEQTQKTQSEQPPEELGVIIARAGKKFFYESDIDNVFASLPENMQSLRDDLDARSQILHTLLRRHVLIQEAISMKLDKDKILQYQMQESRHDILIDALQGWKKKELKESKELDLAKFYTTHRSDYSLPEQIHLRHIIVATHDEAEALIKRLKDGEDFTELANTLSLDDNSKDRGGELDWFGRGMMNHSFENAVFSMDEEGQLSEPFQTQFGWHVAQLMGKKEMQQKSFEEAKEEVGLQLQHEQLQAWLKKLVDESQVQVIRSEYLSKPLQREQSGQNMD
ncbi:MAG: peptidylprolyl isomerase [Mariprofundaceae bacterium]|nr:peptidylprolyl isomerase [Mariprofundaceae bacterium]